MKISNNFQSDDLIKIKILILGDSTVGKTSILLRFCQDCFIQNNIATLGIDFKWKNLIINDTKLRLNIWDTSGQEKYRSITQQYYKGAQGIVLCYSINDRNSFENINKWLNDIDKQLYQPNIILIGTKSDLTERQILYNEGESLAKLYEIEFFETSAKENINIDKCFETLASEILQQVEFQEVFQRSSLSSMPKIHYICKC